MKLSDFDYDLPKELIAQEPAARRDMSRLLVLNRAEDTLSDRTFGDILEYFKDGDVLVLNETKVIPARLLGHKSTGGKAELFLLRSDGDDVWEVLAKPGKRLRIGDRVFFDADGIFAEIIDVTHDGGRIVKFHYEGIWEEWLAKIGVMPLPPYIKNYHGDMSRYQTVFAKKDGSVAAPTAGLHFTEEILAALEAKGVTITKVVLNVGIGTFRPVEVENIEDHQMHSEYFEVTQETADIVNDAKREGRRVITCGTTSTRTIESAADENGIVKAQTGWTNAFFYPGYKFKVIDGLITNFHLPKSTLLMLVSALAGRERVLAAYKHAVKERYRFFSFGDAMLIL